MNRKLVAAIAVAITTPACAGELPPDIWGDRIGGYPAITANRDGVLAVVQEEAIIEAGGGTAAALAKDFLDKWAPGFCTDIVDLQHPRKGMKVWLAIQRKVPGLPFYVVGDYVEVIIDYDPSRKVRCVDENAPTS